MAIISDTLPYMRVQSRTVVLPRNDVPANAGQKIGRMGYGNLAFLFTENISDSIAIMNSTNLSHDGKYYYYYYNLKYYGRIHNRRYNIKNVNDRKAIYDLISDRTRLTPHPPSLLNKTPNRNCYFEMFKYVNIFNTITEKLPIMKRVELFWTFFRSVWFSDQTMNYGKKLVLININNFTKYVGSVKESLKDPTFMIYYTLYKRLDLIQDLDLDFYIFSGNYTLRFNPSKCDKKSYMMYKSQLKRLSSHATVDKISDEQIQKEEFKDEVKSNIVTKYNFTGDDESEVNDDLVTLNDGDKPDDTDEFIRPDTIEDALDKSIDRSIEDKIDTAMNQAKKLELDDKATSDYVKTQTELDLQDDNELIENMYNFMKTQKVPSKPLSSARDKKLRERQESINVNGLSFAKLDKVNAGKKAIPTRDVSSAIKSINDNVKVKKFSNMNKDYIENVMPSDIAKVFTSLNDKDMKLFVRDVKITDSSDELNYKETYHVTLEDESGQRHTVTVDIPKFLENKFMYLGGNKKIIGKQNFLYPVVKTGPDTVQIVTNYNKMFIRRMGTKSIGSVDRIMKVIQSNEEAQSLFTTGNVYSINRPFLTTIEYDEFSKVLSKFETKNCKIFFSQADAMQYMQYANIVAPDNKIFIGIRGKENLFIDADTQLSINGESICDIIVSEFPENLIKEFQKTKTGKRLMYNTVTIMTRAIPLIVLLLFWEGITTVFRKIGLKYYFSKSYPKEVKTNEAVIRFKDAYFVYEEDMQISLLMNGLKVLDTENYNMEDYNSTDAYVDYFKKVYGRINILNAINNYYEFTIDPITREVLEDIDLPTDLVELCIYASNLLADESYTFENSQTLSRVRSTEIIPAILYNEISRAYLVYKNSLGKKKVSLPRDAVIKELLAIQTVEDYSTLNPVVELEKDRVISAKGFRGINVTRAYSEEKRSYHPTMIGIIGMSTSPDGNCGINRELSYEPNITSARGYVDIKDNDLESLKDVNIFSPGELLYPLGATRDDSVRTAMAVKQSKHVIPVKNASPVLISNGVDESIKYELSSDFCITADEDGTVIDYDEDSKTYIVEYKSGKRRAICLAPNVVKNGGGGFYLVNQLHSDLKVGDKVKKDQTLAYHKDFFKDDKYNGVRMAAGALEKVAIMSSYNTFNDSTVITNKLAADAETAVTFCKSIVVGKNSNIYDIRKVGDSIAVGDPLISFDTSFEDNDLNKLLSKLSEANKETLEAGSKNIVKSKYAGKIVDVKIYCTVELEELSDSLRKVVKSYYDKINHKKKFVSKYDTDNSSSIVKCGLLLNETAGKIVPNAYGIIKGEKVEDAVLIEFYIEHGDIMGVGDKLAYFTALKSVIGEVVPEGYEPYSEFRPEEEVSSLIGPSAILKRQVPSITITLLGNKIIVELKRALEKIYNE